MAASTSGMQNFKYPLPTEGRPHPAQVLPKKSTSATIDEKRSLQATWLPFPIRLVRVSETAQASPFSGSFVQSRRGGTHLSLLWDAQPPEIQLEKVV